MTTRGKEFLESEFKRLFQEWYQPKEGSTSAEVMVYGGDTRMIIGKVLEKLLVLQEKYNILAKGPYHLLIDNPSQPAHGNNPGHILMSEELEHHSHLMDSKSLID
ncbi:hypothetical protein DSO57_1012922 [Entomophthora muscae]|uniref:Uncharacterized protein n=1 Tax=Entomophthora muscae TaxID=34485 RepID=A0ACC2T614_9FUNG|nr:hypothetical protein DSO57_1012922 [Entomophthora muscae]